jgi:hypothetical protein
LSTVKHIPVTSVNLLDWNPFPQGKEIDWRKDAQVSLATILLGEGAWPRDFCVSKAKSEALEKNRD